MSTNISSLKVALVYDRVNKWGGAERVLLALHQLFPQAPLYTLVYNPSSAPWAKVFHVIPSFLNRFPFLRSRHELLSLFAPLAFESFNFSQYDLVISITSEAAKSIITRPQTLHLCYCLTPTRYLWSSAKAYKKYPGLGIFSLPASLFLHKYKKRLQNKDLILSHRPDHYISISKTVQKRLKKYYRQNSSIIYPGIDFGFFSALTKPGLKKSNYFLLVSRLVPYKKVSLVIKTFSQLKLPLIVVGTGSQLPRLLSLASPNISFAGLVSNARLRHLYTHARALIFPQKEDFGLTALEAQAAGTPVIAYGYGGAAETVINKKTGLLFPRQTTNSLSIAIAKSKTINLSSLACQKNAQKFDQSFFIKQFSAKVSSLWQQHQAMFM